MITRTFKLCLNAGTGSAPFINVSQTDKDETWLFELYTETGERYIPSSGAIIGIKADGHGIANTGTVDSEGRVVITETEQMTAAAGRSIFELSIDGLTHGTANFIVNVEKKPIDGAIMSDSDLSLISQAVDSAAVIVDVIGDGDPSEVIGEHVDAWLDNHPEATTTVEDGAITAPKINNSLWDKLLVSEEVSGNPASFDDGADDVPVSSLKVALEPVQLGSGDPSPTNIRPIYPANGKNLLQNTGTSKTENGITWTLNADGSVKCVGTATANSLFVVNTFNFESDKTYILTGCPSGGATSTKWQIQILADLSGGATKVETGTGETISGLSGQYYVRLVVRSGNTVDFTWYPMICLASITDSTYQPYQGIMAERTGKNLLDPSQFAKVKYGNDNVFTVNGDNITVNLTDYNAASTLLSNSPIAYLNKGTYTVSLSITTRIQVMYYDNNNTIQTEQTLSSNSITFTLERYTPVTMKVIASSYPTTFKAQIEHGSEATEYEEYIAPTSYPYTLGQSVYGGTVDLATGVLTVTHVYYQRNFSTPTSKDSQNRWIMSFYPPNASSALFGKMWDLTTYSADYGFLSDSLQIHLENAEVANASTCAFYGHSSAFEYRVRVPDTYTADEAKAIADANHIVYPIEPQTIQLTPQEVKTLLGYNNISSTGTVDVIYHADTKLYVDKLTAVDNNIIAPTEATFTATRNYTVNDLVIVNDTLYKCTANIASGSAITPNSNVTQTTLSALIKALS